MKEFVEKLIERLEEKRMDYFLTLANTGDEKLDFAYENIGDLIDSITVIVNILSEEYKGNLSEKLTGWIPVTERLPESEKEVLIIARRKYTGGKILEIVTTAMYEDGTVREDDSRWNWSDIEGEWDEEKECYIIPEGWWEYKHYF